MLLFVLLFLGVAETLGDFLTLGNSFLVLKQMKMAFLFDLKLLQCFCIICKGGQNVLISKNHLHKNTENIAGKLTFYQMDGNSTYVRNTGELASDVPTETMFELFDPLQNFSSAKFSYTWDLGNGYSPPY